MSQLGEKLLMPKNINFKKLSSSLKFKNFYQIKNKSDLNKRLKNFLSTKGPSFLEVKIKKIIFRKIVKTK